MSLSDKVVTVGVVLFVFAPIIGLMLWRLWRGEVQFEGFWVTPREFKALQRQENDGERPPE